MSRKPRNKNESIDNGLLDLEEERAAWEADSKHIDEIRQQEIEEATAATDWFDEQQRLKSEKEFIEEWNEDFLAGRGSVGIFEGYGDTELNDAFDDDYDCDADWEDCREAFDNYLLERWLAQP